MNLLKEFEQYIKQQNLFNTKDKLLLAVSGGVDSVVLCELCRRAGFDFFIAHCNFQLRAAESERDENFVRELGKKYAVEVFVKKFDTEKYAADNKCSIQVAARELRYAWFDEILNDVKNNFVSKTGKQPATVVWLLTAHHANDNIETLLLNFFKGTGISGLHGILPKQKNICRPLLFAKKETLLAFANENQLPFVEDSSNASNKYARNYFRNELIPGLQKVFPQVEENLLDNIERFSEIEVAYLQFINQQKKGLMENKGNEVHIPVLKLLKAKPLKSIVFEIIKDFGFTAHQTGEVIGLLTSESGKYIPSASHRIIKNRNWLIISPNKSTEAINILVEKTSKKIKFQPGTISFDIITSDKFSGHIQTANYIAQLDAGEIKFPLLLRKWKAGDYFYPLGMNRKKKLSRFFIDQKLSITQKENTWVLEMDKKIIWVVGMRIDNRFKVKSNTKKILQVTLAVS
ncbi:MAG: tRNA lysidine(34) synthetase TilS [Ferruginibacter sp.]|nr:tRNA lysidine(34) synthetase TilS [Bacteroidota bacterium]MBX2919760.1 tRNA lysidine(34) synthetase TilS [Ferruginibacter sp.]MCB0707981.1 tRNA lysidine(34) synthetase TilS [Chitinophagaceae bacterium]